MFLWGKKKKKGKKKLNFITVEQLSSWTNQFFKPLHYLCISLQAEPCCFLYISDGMCMENMFNNQKFLHFAIITFILINLQLASCKHDTDGIN